MRPRTPIEMMIDKACGFDSEEAEKIAAKKFPVLVRCLGCKSEMRDKRRKGDPRGTAVVEQFQKCCAPDPWPVSYFDGAGNLLERIE